MDTNINPQISIITVTRNRAGFIAKAIESAQKQSFTDWELLVLDDDSNDGTGAILEAFMTKDNRIKYYKNSPALGISKNRNLGLSKASGKYIAVLDSDDEWIDKDKLQKQFNFLENNPDYVLIGSNIKIVNEKGNFIKNTDFVTEDKGIRNKILAVNQIPHSSVIYRKDFSDKISGYDEKLSCVEDLDFFLRLGKLGKFKNLKENTTAYTKHSEGISHKKRLAMSWNHFKIVLKNFGKYPNWFYAIIFAKLRIIKNLF
jgi:glycosyltransferase involved in cell wall biosynthesis